MYYIEQRVHIIIHIVYILISTGSHLAYLTNICAHVLAQIQTIKQKQSQLSRETLPKLAGCSFQNPHVCMYNEADK